MGRYENILSSLGAKFKVVIEPMFLRFLRYENFLKRLHAKLKVVIDITFLSKIGDKV